METWYSVDKWMNKKPEPIEVKSHTEKMLTFAPSKYCSSYRAAKKSEYRTYFPSYAEAAEYMRSKLEDRIRVAELEIIDSRRMIESL